MKKFGLITLRIKKWIYNNIWPFVEITKAKRKIRFHKCMSIRNERKAQEARDDNRYLMKRWFNTYSFKYEQMPKLQGGSFSVYVAPPIVSMNHESATVQTKILEPQLIGLNIPKSTLKVARETKKDIVEIAHEYFIYPLAEHMSISLTNQLFEYL